ncbi:MAG: ABC transporter substrate-binding protein, partial [Deltaproteobacteria bacterium]|nr:ABC transporter substrate-binding protein [Deltaproteobacteria bacterium]
MKKSLAATLLVAGIWSAGGAGAETGVTDKTILVGTSQSLSGPLAGPGQEQVAAMEAYMEYVNSQGGVNGRKLEWKWYDDGYRPQDAMANMRRLVEQDGVFVVPLNQGTSPVLAVVPYLQEKKVPL